MAAQTQTADLAEKVARGMALLDEQYPGWWQPGNVSISRLDMGDGCACVLAQAAGDTYYAEAERLRFGLAEGTAHGFRTPGGDVAWRQLDEAWREAIARRREGAGHAQ